MRIIQFNVDYCGRFWDLNWSERLPERAKRLLAAGEAERRRRGLGDQIVAVLFPNEAQELVEAMRCAGGEAWLDETGQEPITITEAER